MPVFLCACNLLPLLHLIWLEHEKLKESKMYQFDIYIKIETVTQ